MYNPIFLLKKNGVPILSKNDINSIAEGFLKDFAPECLEIPQAIDVDAFADLYLGLNIDYQYLSYCGLYLGMTVFNDTDSVVVFNPREEKAEFLSVSARTIIIDNSLLEEGKEKRYRFTMGHECGHDILHQIYFEYKPNQLSLFESDNMPMIQCRRVEENKGKADTSLWDDHDWMEWQANNFASSLLMPKSMVELLLKDDNFDSNFLAVCEKIEKVAETFNVSFQAAEYRLKSLGMISESFMENMLF